LYYFAYGSNMDWQQMQRRCPSARFVCIGRLPDYRFAIARHSRLRNCGTANIIADPCSEVWGIVYDINAEDLAKLDSFEDGYRREHVVVSAQRNGHGALEVLVYIAPLEENAPLPNRQYRQHLLDGAVHWRLPKAYRTMLQAIPVTER